MRGQVLLALGALAATLALAQPAAAQPSPGPAPRYDYDAQDCEQVRNGRTAGGAIIGGILGAVIGNNVAGDQSDGSMVGGLLGAVAGGAIGRNSVQCDRYAQGDAYYGGPRDPDYRDRPYDDDSSLYGGPGDPRFHPRARACEWRTVRWRDDWGRPQRERIYVCQGRDGRWRRMR